MLENMVIFMARLARLIRQIVTVPAAKEPPATRQIQVPNPIAAVNPVFGQWTDEPLPNAAIETRRLSQFNLIFNRLFFIPR